MDAELSTGKAALMAAAYSVTTPLGTAVGAPGWLGPAVHPSPGAAAWVRWPPIPPALPLLPPPPARRSLPPARPTTAHTERLRTRAGIGVREAFNASSTAALLSVGFLDALAAGVLLYVALAQLIHPGLTDSEWLRARGWPLQAAAHAALWAGAAVMAVIGKWA